MFVLLLKDGYKVVRILLDCYVILFDFFRGCNVFKSILVNMLFGYWFFFCWYVLVLLFECRDESCRFELIWGGKRERVLGSVR